MSILLLYTVQSNYLCMNNVYPFTLHRTIGIRTILYMWLLPVTFNQLTIYPSISINLI